MTESKQDYKFGTWYPIEELEFDKDVLLGGRDVIVIGQKSKDDDGHFEGFFSSDGLYLFHHPSHWMPLPPRPGEEPKPDTLALLVKSIADIDPEIEKIFKKNIRDLA